MADLQISARAIGIKELDAILRNNDKKLLRSTQAMMRKAASPMTAQARSLTPLNGTLNGWAHNGRTGWRDSEVLSGISVKVGGRSLRTNEWTLLTLQQNSAAGMIYDWAGRAGGSSQFVKALPKLGGQKGSQYSRVLFPAFVATRSEVVRAVQDGVDEVARKLNIEIERI